MNTQKGFAPILLILLGVMAIGGGVYVYYNTREIVKESLATEVSFIEEGDILSLLINNEKVQTLTMINNAEYKIASADPNLKKFITTLDVNFDGHNDVGVFTSTGYAGVNNFYNFYIYNSETQKLEKNEQLVGISNPDINKDKREVSSNYRSGPIWYRDTYNYANNNYKYIEDPEVSNKLKVAQDELQKQDRVYTNSDFGFYIKYPGGYVLSEDDKGQINLSFSSMRGPVVITKSVEKADDSTGKWGKYVVWHSDTGWLVESANERDGRTSIQVTNPFTYTDSGLAILNGGTNGHGWGAYSYIVALSENKFLIISGPDRLDENALEYNEKEDPTLIIAKRISVIK